MRDSKHRKPVQIGPACRHRGPVRRAGDIQYVVIHDAEAPSNAAPGVASYGSRTDRVVSWHVVCDDNILIRQVPNLITAWAAPGANFTGLQIELCGYARYSKLQWYRHQATLKRGAWQVARWCKTFGIPPVFLTDYEVRLGDKKGLVTHAQVSRVFRKSDHSDPGPNFPLGYFALLVRRRRKWLG